MAKPTIIGINPQTGRAITIGDIERRSGLYVLGKPGTGKSALLVNLLRQDCLNQHGVFFLDPHGDAIEDLVNRISADDMSLKELREFFFLLTPVNEHFSFCINPLSCTNPASLTERTDTYTRAYNVFHKLWEDEWGPWLQLILQNTLYVFIENQDYTLAEVPLFLMDKAFRHHLVSRMRFNRDVADFWRYEFGAKRERDQQEQVQSALTRVRTLLNHQYVRDIVGHQTTVNFTELMARRAVVLVSLPATLAPDIKKFIGTLLMSEFVHAIRNRPIGKRSQVCIFIDEFQTFLGLDDCTTLITESRKHGCATTIAHVERYGAFADNPKLLGATAATANKVFFQLTVRDSQESSTEFAGMADDLKTRVGGELIISPRPVEDIWERGHPDQQVMELRERYLWLVDLLRSRPNERYYVFDPAGGKHEPGDEGILKWEAFHDWAMYRASPDMLREGIALLNHYYYEGMARKSGTAGEATAKPDHELARILKVIECFSGVFGWRPTMEPYIPEDMRALFVRRLNEQGDRNHREFSNEIQMQHRAIEHDAEKWIRHHPYAFRHEHPPQGYPMTAHEVQKIIHDHRPKDWHVSDISETPALEDIWSLRNSAITLGFTQAELETLFQWRIRPLHPLEARRLTDVVAMTLQMREAPGRYRQEWPRVRRSYTAMMAHDLIVAKFGRAHKSLPEEAVMPYLQTVTERIAWQLAALQQFILRAFRACPAVFLRAPVKVSSAIYEDAPKREKTQGELIDEMAVAMTQTPRFTAYAKVIHEQDGHQTVLKRKIVTLPLPSLPARPLSDAEGHSPTTIIELNTIRAGLYRPRAQIEQEVRRRREHWHKRPDSEKPPDASDAPPPTSEPPPTHD